MRIVSALALLLLALLAVPSILLFAALQPDPLVTAAGSMRHDSVSRIKALVKQNDPRQFGNGEIHTLEIVGPDLNLLLASVLPLPRRQGIQVALEDGEASVLYTLALPANPLGQYLNISARLRQDNSLPALQQLQFGDTAVPTWLVSPLLAAADRWLRDQSAEYEDARSALREIRLQPDAIQIVYQWQTGLAERLQATGRELLLSPAERERIVTYYAELVRQSRLLDGATTSLDRLLQPLFELAQQRSARGTDPGAENRGLLLALGVALSGHSPEHLVGKPDGATLPALTPLNLVLGGRQDLALHFAISAAISAGGGSALADSIGIFKEMDDSRGGSGFSFADLLADRAGVAMAEVAMGKDAGALQAYMAGDLRESGYMPGFDKLPEGLMELEFKHRYENLDSATYALVDSEIARRIGGCTIHRPGFGQAR